MQGRSTEDMPGLSAVEMQGRPTEEMPGHGPTLTPVILGSYLLFRELQGRSTEEMPGHWPTFIPVILGSYLLFREMQGRSTEEMPGRSEMQGRSTEEIQGLPSMPSWSTLFLATVISWSEYQQQKKSLERMRKESLLVDALSRHRDILKRETSFLMREVSLRNLDSVAGKISYLESQSSSGSLERSLIWKNFLSGKISTDSREIKVSLPYLVPNHDEAVDFLLHESMLLRYRIQSLTSIMEDFSIPGSYEKARMLMRMSTALKWISQCILRADKKTKKKAISRKEQSSSVEKEDISSYKEHCLGWKSLWGSRTPNHGFFNDITTLSSMQFTCATPGRFPYSATTGAALQIYSICICDLNPNLDWPLIVWGVVAARDAVDRNRNILFYRSWANRQKLTQDDPVLCLTGPSRAIVAVEDVTFEVELQIKYGEDYQHTAVLAGRYRYHSACDGNPEIARGCCTAKLSLEQFRSAIQATIVGLQVDEKGWPLLEKNGCQVYCCYSRSAADVMKARKIMLLDCRGVMPKGSDRYIPLSRNVVTVKSEGTLRVAIAYPSHGNGHDIQGHVDFPVRSCKTSEREVFVGNCKVKVVVAWSLIAMNKENLALEGYVPV